MVAGLTRRLRVPRFASLNDFLLAKKWYLRALNIANMPCLYLEGPERDDLQQRLWRHDLPGLSPFQLRFKHTHKIHIRDTSAPG
jgi:hypothetical protein